ncbi:MAG: phage distal tail protein [Sarcina sp.]
MRINNIDIKKFGAKVEKKYISTSNIEVIAEWNKNSKVPHLLDSIITFKTIKIELLFRAFNRDAILKNISNFMTNVIECDIKFRNLSNNYHCYFQQSDEREAGLDDWLFVDLEFIGYEYSDEIELNCSNVSNKQIDVVGNKQVPIILEIIPTIDTIDLVINGLSEDPIKIKNLKANKKITFDSYKGTVLEETSNKFDDTDFWEFPFLIPGINNISFSKNNMQIKIKYKPMWL